MRIEVTAYSGYKANEKPERFVLDGHAYRVEEVLDQWYDPEAIYFKIRADDGNLYILRYDHSSDAWTLESFRKGPPEPR